MNYRALFLDNTPEFSARVAEAIAATRALLAGQVVGRYLVDVNQ